MATKMKSKPVVRELEIIRDNRTKARKCDQVMVALYPNGTIGFRAKHSRREYRLPLSTAYNLAVRSELDADKKEKAKQKKLKKLNGE